MARLTHGGKIIQWRERVHQAARLPGWALGSRPAGGTEQAAGLWAGRAVSRASVGRLHGPLLPWPPSPTVPGLQPGEEDQVCLFLSQPRWGEAVHTHPCTHTRAHTFTRRKGEACARTWAEPSAVTSVPWQPNHPVHETHDVSRPTRHVSRNLMNKQKQRHYLNLSPAGGEGTGVLSPDSTRGASWWWG